MEPLGGNLKVPWSSMELGSIEKVPRNSMELWIWTKFHGILWNSMELEVLLLKFHGIPWNHGCCSKSSMELWRKFHETFRSK